MANRFSGHGGRRSGEWQAGKALVAANTSGSSPDRALHRAFGPTTGYARHPQLEEASSRVVGPGLHALVYGQMGGWRPSFGWRRQLYPIDVRRHRRFGRPAEDYPDALVVAKPLRATDGIFPINAHIMDILPVDTVQVADVHRTAERGRGANSAWVFFVCTADAVLNWKRLRASESFEASAGDTAGAVARKQLSRAALERGVGLVAMLDPGDHTTWYEIMPAQYRVTANLPSDAREELCSAADGFSFPEGDAIEVSPDVRRR
jgi:hypothetical protein